MTACEQGLYRMLSNAPRHRWIIALLQAADRLIKPKQGPTRELKNGANAHGATHHRDRVPASLLGWRQLWNPPRMQPYAANGDRRTAAESPEFTTLPWSAWPLLVNGAVLSKVWIYAKP